MKDVIYKDEDYIIIKKGVDEEGHFEPTTLLDLIAIATGRLKDWKNMGFQKRDHAEDVIEIIKEQLSECLS